VWPAQFFWGFRDEKTTQSCFCSTAGRLAGFGWNGHVELFAFWVIADAADHGWELEQSPKYDDLGFVGRREWARN
jgi:hypothetical protein